MRARDLLDGLDAQDAAGGGQAVQAPVGARLRSRTVRGVPPSPQLLIVAVRRAEPMARLLALALEARAVVDGA